MLRLRTIAIGLIAAAVLPPVAWTQPPMRVIPARPVPIRPAPPRPPMPSQGSIERQGTPRLEAIAETKLLMEGLAHPNYKAVSRLLAEEPADLEAWQLARGQSLIIAETANLLMLRPPKDASAERAWMSRATELRDSSTTLARTAAKRDLAKSRLALDALAASCNRCHETFRIEVRVGAREK